MRWLALGLAALGVSACGFTGNLRANPGFASFSAPSLVPGAEREFALSLGPVPMRLATMISRPFLSDEPWIPDLLRTVKAVRVYTYRVDGDVAPMLHHLEDTRAGLIADGWDPIAAVREDSGIVSALVMQLDPQVLQGVVVMSLDDEELVLVNVIGKMTPESLSAVMKELDLDLPPFDVELPEVDVDVI